MGSSRKHVRWSFPIAEIHDVGRVDTHRIGELFYQTKDVDTFEADVVKEEVSLLKKENASAYEEMIGLSMDRWAAAFELSNDRWDTAATTTVDVELDSTNTNKQLPTRASKRNSYPSTSRRSSRISTSRKLPSDRIIKCSPPAKEEEQVSSSIRDDSSASLSPRKTSCAAVIRCPIRQASASFSDDFMQSLNSALASNEEWAIPDDSKKENSTASSMIANKNITSNSRCPRRQPSIDIPVSCIFNNSIIPENTSIVVDERERSTSDDRLRPEQRQQPTMTMFSTTTTALPSESSATTIEIPVEMISPSMHRRRLSVEGPELNFLLEKEKQRREEEEEEESVVATRGTNTCFKIYNKLDSIDEMIDMESSFNSITPESQPTVALCAVEESLGTEHSSTDSVRDNENDVTEPTTIADHSTSYPIPSSNNEQNIIEDMLKEVQEEAGNSNVQQNCNYFFQLADHLLESQRKQYRPLHMKLPSNALGRIHYYSVLPPTTAAKTTTMTRSLQRC